MIGVATMLLVVLVGALDVVALVGVVVSTFVGRLTLMWWLLTLMVKCNSGVVDVGAMWLRFVRVVSWLVKLALT